MINATDTFLVDGPTFSWKSHGEDIEVVMLIVYANCILCIHSKNGQWPERFRKRNENQEKIEVKIIWAAEFILKTYKDERRKKTRNEEIPMEKLCAININFPGISVAVSFHWMRNLNRFFAFVIRSIRHKHTHSKISWFIMFSWEKWANFIMAYKSQKVDFFLNLLSSGRLIRCGRSIKLHVVGIFL